MKYLVMEIFNSYAVLLDEDGRFVKSANPGYEVGETIQNPVLMRDKPLEKRKIPTKLVSAVVAIAAMVTLFFGYNFYQENYTPYSSIFMAINPEVEMVLSRKGQVLEVEGTNEDGVALLEGFEPTSDNKTDVANELVDRAIEMGFLAEGGRISFAIDTPDQVLFEQYGIELREEVDGRISITIEITDMESRNQPQEEPEQKPEPEPEQEQKPEAEPEPVPEPEPKPDPTPEPEPEPESEQAPQLISLDEAKRIAFNHAGVSGENADFDDEDLESDDGIQYYELSFDIGDDEYDYDIDARTGQILDFDHDIEDDDDEN